MKIYNRIILIGIILVTSPLLAQEKELIYDDWVYDPNIRTITFHPKPVRPQDQFNAPIISIVQNQPLLLEFDHLNADYNDFRVRLIHCNADWTPSFYTNLEILDEYNEFNINDYDFSFNTRVDYVHYWFEVPQVKVSGNYLLVVFQNGDEDDYVLTRRFSVYENSTSITNRVVQSNNVSTRLANQQIDFSVNYSPLQVNNPFTQLKIIIRQNQRWDNAIQGLQPTMVRENIRTLDYFHVNNETNFQAGNEFRFFDLRTVDFNGQGVAKVERDPKEIRAYKYVDESRFGLPYSIQMQDDINGKFVVNNMDLGPGRGVLEGQYAKVFFLLESPVELEDDVYVLGQLTDWKRLPSNRMQYNKNKGMYELELLLKQAWYNYIYWVDSSNPYHFEGIRFETENEYEILVYFRPQGGRGDLLVGYSNFFSNLN
jgi:hypothetical protein